MRRKVYISIGAVSEQRPKAKAFIVDEDNLQDIQSQIALLIADDFAYEQVVEQVEAEQAQL
jgi:hypothetical protein